MWASRDGHTEVVKLLIAANANVNLRNSEGDTALKLASSKHHYAVAGLLIAAGAVLH